MLNSLECWIAYHAAAYRRNYMPGHDSDPKRGEMHRLVAQALREVLRGEATVGEAVAAFESCMEASRPGEDRPTWKWVTGCHWDGLKTEGVLAIHSATRYPAAPAA